jgi:hypothetical protein
VVNPLVLTNRPARVDLDLYAGDTVAIPVVVYQGEDRVDLTGTNTAAVRVTPQEPIEEDLPVIIELTDAVEGEALIYVDGTGDYTDGFTGFWDWELIQDDDTIRTICAGTITIAADVTRA